MSTSPLPFRSPASRHTTAEVGARKAEDFESMAQLVEDSIPNFKKDEEKHFYSEVGQSYRQAARDVLRKVWSDDHGQDIAEYAVMLAVILVGTIRLIGSNANTVFSQAASSIQQLGLPTLTAWRTGESGKQFKQEDRCRSSHGSSSV